MRKISAQYIFPVTSKPLKKGIIIIDDKGKIIDIIDTKGELKETAGVEFFNGIIVPGFINTHCHLELSYLKEKIPKNTGHPEFIKQIIHNIKTIIPDIKIIEAADLQMQKEGIVAVGDISNVKLSFDVKRKSPIYYHTFIELADFFNEQKAEKDIANAEVLQKEISNTSIVPHAPYSCSPNFIAKTAGLTKNVYSIHNQEAKSEDEMYNNGSGDIFNLMTERDLISNFISTKKSSLQSYLSEIVRENLNILLIHNVYSSDEDIEFAEDLSDNIYWTLCPKSNRYIQDNLPNAQKFIKNNCKITLGTDSLATNDKLSILEEMKNFINFDFSEVLKWATLNGAKSLKIDDIYGSIEIGKTPGLNLISSFDFNNFKLKKNSKVEKIV